MADFSLLTGIFITLGTVLVFFFFSSKEDKQVKTMFALMLFTIYFYSGIGCSYRSVSNKYIISYFLFIFFLCVTVKLIFKYRFTFGGSSRNSIAENSILFDFDYNDQMVVIFTIIFIVTNAMHLFVPNFNLIKFFMPGAPTSELIYARRAATQNNAILKICSTVNSFCFPFFCLYLKKLVDKKRKGFAILLILLWAYLDYLQYDYLSRYQMLIFLAFAFCLGAFIYPEGIVIKKKYITIALIGFVVLAPFLNAYTAIRNGINTTVEFNNIGNSLYELIETEIYYPTHYNICEDMYGTESILNFILWMICLPIPSVIFPWKPTVQLAYSFTYAVTGLQYGKQAYYTSSLPSVVGEGIILFGPWLVGFYGIILGIFIGFYFKFIRKYQSLCVLYLYMTLMILTIGRGGASSYMSTLINGTVAMLLWGYVFNKNRRNLIQQKEIKQND